jgi:predicted ATP-grasp superfamily ATP-dependent carboligase
MLGEELPPSWAVEGFAMRRAIAEDFARVTSRPVQVSVLRDERLPNVAGPWNDIPWKTRSEGQGGQMAFLVELASDFDCTILIAPETSGILSQWTRSLEQAGIRHLGSSSAAVALTADKLRLETFLSTRGIPTPGSRLFKPDDEQPQNFPWPVVLKPIDGAGSVSTFLLGPDDEVPEEARRMGPCLLQPFLRGIPCSASFLVSETGVAHLIGIGRQQMVIRAGRFQYEGGEIPERGVNAEGPIRESLKAVAGLRGFVGVDFIWNLERQVATILEINPRPTTSYVGLVRLLKPGRLAGAWLRVCGDDSGYGGVEAGDDPLGTISLADVVQDSLPVRFTPDGSWSLASDEVVR